MSDLQQTGWPGGSWDATLAGLPLPPVAAVEGAAAQSAATTLAEQLAMEEAMAGAGERIMQGLINDPAYPEDIWAKMQWVHQNLTTGENIVIHYWQNLETGISTGFKYK